MNGDVVARDFDTEVRVGVEGDCVIVSLNLTYDGVCLGEIELGEGDAETLGKTILAAARGEAPFDG